MCTKVNYFDEEYVIPNQRIGFYGPFKVQDFGGNTAVFFEHNGRYFPQATGITPGNSPVGFPEFGLEVENLGPES